MDVIQLPSKSPEIDWPGDVSLQLEGSELLWLTLDDQSAVLHLSTATVSATFDEHGPRTEGFVGPVRLVCEGAALLHAHDHDHSGPAGIREGAISVLAAGMRGLSHWPLFDTLAAPTGGSLELRLELRPAGCVHLRCHRVSAQLLPDSRIRESWAC